MFRERESSVQSKTGWEASQRELLQETTLAKLMVYWSNRPRGRKGRPPLHFLGTSPEYTSYARDLPRTEGVAERKIVPKTIPHVSPPIQDPTSRSLHRIVEAASL